MNITIEVSETVPEDAFGRVQALARRVVVNDVTFQGTTIDVKRACFDTVPARVRDSTTQCGRTSCSCWWRKHYEVKLSQCLACFSKYPRGGIA